MIEKHVWREMSTAKAIAVAMALFLVGSIAVLWSWNTLAVDLFQLPQARFKHAIAFVVLLGVMSTFRWIAARRSD